MSKAFDMALDIHVSINLQVDAHVDDFTMPDSLHMNSQDLSFIITLSGNWEPAWSNGSIW